MDKQTDKLTDRTQYVNICRNSERCRLKII